MTPEERRQGAFEELNDLLSEGIPVSEAIIAAAENNDLKPENFRAVAEKHLGDLETHRVKMQHRAIADRFVWAAKDEIERCKQNVGIYAKIGPLRTDVQIFAIKEQLAVSLERNLSEHEIWMIGEMLNPFYSELKTNGFKNRELLKVLLERQMKC